MEFLFDAVYTSTVAIPHVPPGSGEPGRVWTQEGELRSDPKWRPTITPQRPLRPPRQPSA